jgi:DNA-binding LacI/PurR family transcriptional regulator
MAGPTPPRRGRLTQREIARLAGVSQTTVSLVLNNHSLAASRIAPETRDRVMRVIRETGYVADPLARRLQQQHNQILGVFTYEPVFPTGSADFYHPFLVGIEACAEQFGCDLLLFTSAPVTDGHRRIFHENYRLRLADGCVLLGREIPRNELARLVQEGHPFVSVGRRDDAYDDAGPGGGYGGPVPYVGADYVSATADLTRRALRLGHRRLAYLGAGAGAESSADRFRGLREVAPDAVRLDMTTDVDALLDQLRVARVTVVFCERAEDAWALEQAARSRGIRLPEELSLVALGDPITPLPVGRDYTGFRIPRREMGWQSVELLTEILHGPGDTRCQRLLPCVPVEGGTLAPPARG